MELYSLPVRLWDPATEQVVATTIDALAPHEMFSMAFCRDDRTRWEKCFLGPRGDEACSEFWRLAAEADWGQYHAVLLKSMDAKDGIIQQTVPVRYHADGAETFNNTEYHIFSWASCLVDSGDVLSETFLTCIIDETQLCAETYRDVVQFMAWSNAVMESGRFPDKDHLGHEWPERSRRRLLAGTELAEGWRASFCAWYGDLKERHMAHKFARYYQRHFLCERCLAHQTMQSCYAYDFRPCAEWRDELQSHEHYLATTPEEHRSPFVQIPQWTIHRCRHDLLHLIYLGFGKDLAGGLLLCLARHFSNTYSSHAALNASLRSLWHDFRTWCKTRRINVNLPVFTLKTITWEATTDFPCLSTRIKAASCRCLLKWLAVKAPRKLGGFKTVW